jgi:hypothetical protein
VPGGSYLWFNSTFRVRDVRRQKITISFFQSSVQFQYTGGSRKDGDELAHDAHARQGRDPDGKVRVEPELALEPHWVAADGGNAVKVNQPMPDAKIVIDPDVTTASTTFDAEHNVWITTIPFDLDDNTFLTGTPWQVPAGGLPADVEPVTWCGTFASDTVGVDIEWRWAAAAYSSLGGDNTTLGVKPMDTDHDNPAANRDRAGTPENFKHFVVPGGSGEGRKNYTGSYSGSAKIE